MFSMFSNGWFFIVTGVIGLLAGAYGTWAISHGYHLLSDKNPAAKIIKASVTSNSQFGAQTAEIIHNNYYGSAGSLPQKTPTTPQAEPAHRETINRTPRELLSFYTPERTQLEANRLMQPFIGEWIEVSGVVSDVGHGAPDGDQMAVILKSDNDQIECRFSRTWTAKLDRLAKGESIKIIGKISPTQNGSQLYLLECELIPFVNHPISDLNKAKGNNLRLLQKEYKVPMNVPMIVHYSDNQGNESNLEEVPKDLNQRIINCRQGDHGDLHPGDTLIAKIEVDPSFEPSDYTVSWFVFGFPRQVGNVAKFQIENKHVNEQMEIGFEVISKRDWHRQNGLDDSLRLLFRVLPPQT